MRRSEITKSVNRILNTIKQTEVDKAVIDMLKSSEKNFQSFLNATNKFSISYSNFSNAEKELVEILGLKPIVDMETIGKILVSSERNSDLRMLHESIYFAKHQLPKMLEVFKQSHVDLIELDSNDRKNDLNKDSIILILPEDEGHSSSPERLKEALEAMIQIYSVCAEINGYASNELSVIGIDSGSDKSFDFLGNAEVVKCIKELFLELWDRIVFYRERKLHEKLELVAKALPIMEKIKSMEQEEAIEKEQAEIFRRSVTDGVNKILKTGALIPEIEINSSYNVRELMSPEPKMLTEGVYAAEDRKGDFNDDDFNDDDFNDDDFNEEEQKLLKKLMDKKNKNKDK